MLQKHGADGLVERYRHYTGRDIAEHVRQYCLNASVLLFR